MPKLYQLFLIHKNFKPAGLVEVGLVIVSLRQGTSQQCVSKPTRADLSSQRSREAFARVAEDGSQVRGGHPGGLLFLCAQQWGLGRSS